MGGFWRYPPGLARRDRCPRNCHRSSALCWSFYHVRMPRPPTDAEPEALREVAKRVYADLRDAKEPNAFVTIGAEPTTP